MNTRLLGNKLHPILKSVGFRRKSSTWNRMRGNFVEVVNLQRSQWSVDVTLNISVAVPWICEIKQGHDNKDFFGETNGLARVRAGYLVDSRDVWWDMEEEGTPGKLIAVINEHVFPYFSSLPDYASLVERITKQVSSTVPKWSDLYPFDGINLDLALLAYLRGEQDRAQEMFKTMIRRNPGRGDETFRRIYGKVFGDKKDDGSLDFLLPSAIKNSQE